MTRKKWSELEELTLLEKYSDLVQSGTLQKMKTREKKFKPIAEYVNSVHHLQDSLAFPFKWSWRDVSIKVQNMRHQYLGVKQKITVTQDEFNWSDGENYWTNFLKYKEVLGDVELERNTRSDMVKDGLSYELRYDFSYSEQEGDDEEEVDDIERDEDTRAVGSSRCVKRKASLSKKLNLLTAQVVNMRNTLMQREQRKREMEFNKEICELEGEMKRKVLELEMKLRMREKCKQVEDWAMDLEERELLRLRLDAQWEEKRKKKRMAEEAKEQEEMEWRERMIRMQIEHEKAMMQMHGDAWQNQLHILNLMGRLICQFFGLPNDASGNLGGFTPQNLSDNGLADSGKPSDFL